MNDEQEWHTHRKHPSHPQHRHWAGILPGTHPAGGFGRGGPAYQVGFFRIGSCGNKSLMKKRRKTGPHIVPQVQCVRIG